MDFGKLLSRAWDVVWNNAFLVLLGVLAALGDSGLGGGNQSRFVFQGDRFHWQDMPGFDYRVPFRGWDLPAAAVGAILLLVVGIVIVGLLFWALGTISRGGLISAVDDLEERRPTDFVTAFQNGWEKGWRLLGIGLIPAVPGLVLGIFFAASLVFGDGLSWIRGASLSWDWFSRLSPILVLACLLIPAGLILSLLQTFANRACMLEDTGVLASYQRGFQVLGENLGPALLLFLLQIAISLGVAIIMFVPGLLMALCCLLWPLLLLLQGTFRTYFSTLWTLAWREWVRVPEPAA